MVNDTWLPADWRIERTTDSGGTEHVTVYSPGYTGGMTMDHAIILRDILTTTSRPENRRAILTR